MLDVEVLYLIGNSNSTNIVKIHNNIILEKTIYNLINEECLKTLTTIDGRVEATKQIFQIYKLIPLYLNEGLILQPLYSSKNYEQIYINICNIKKINKVNDHSVITFINDKTLLVDIKVERIKRYLKRCLKIKDYQNKFKII
ncbi:MAG: competence protein ComK [Bacilli bacterium]|nr:competence protein ComK [Bacilli bacterium]